MSLVFKKEDITVCFCHDGDEPVEGKTDDVRRRGPKVYQVQFSVSRC